MARKKNENPNETKAEKFVRLGETRTGKAIKMISSIESLAGSGYESTPEQREKIVAALENAVANVKAVFDGETKPDSGFKL